MRAMYPREDGHEVSWADAEPGDAFLAVDEDQWAIWKFLDGPELELARELGYHRRVVAVVLVGDDMNLPHSPKTDLNDPAWAMQNADLMPFDTLNLPYMGKL